MGARCALGFHGFEVWGLPILHGPLRHQDRSTTVRLLRVMLGLVGPGEAVVRVDPGCAAPGSVGGPHLRGMVSVGVGVRGRCFLRASLTLGVLSVSRGGPRGVMTSGMTDARSAVSMGATQNSTDTNYLAVRTSRVREFPVVNKTMLRKRRAECDKGKKKGSGCVGKGVFTAHIGIHIHPYTGYPIRPLEPPGYR